MRMMPASKVLRPHSIQDVVTTKAGSNYQSTSVRTRNNKVDDFDSAVRDEMNRLEKKLKSMISDAGPSSQQNYEKKGDRGSTSANSNAYNNGQHVSLPSELQIGFGTDPANDRALKKAKQVEYKRQLDSFGNNTKDSNGRMRNRSQSPERNRGGHSNFDGPPSNERRQNFDDYGGNSDSPHDGYQKPVNSIPKHAYTNGPASSSQRDFPQMRSSYPDNYNKPAVSKTSPTQARLRLVKDMYGASSVIADSHASPTDWKPSMMGQGEELDRKRLAALEHKSALDDQIAHDRRRKELEKERDRQSDDKAMQKMIKQHEEDRERERNAREALRLAMKKDAARTAGQEKFSEDAMARHNRNTRSKGNTLMKSKTSYARQNDATPHITPRKANLPSQMKSSTSQKITGRSPAGSGMHAVAARENRGLGAYESQKALSKKNAALDYQRALDEQIFDDRKKKDEAKNKEAEDELAFMRALRGDNFGSEKKPKVDFSFDSSPPNGRNGDREFEPSLNSTDVMKKSTDGLQNIMKNEDASNPSYIERLPFTMGSAVESRRFQNSMRRAATPGGALECETHMTDENTMMFLQRPYTPNGSTRYAVSDVDEFVHQFDKHGPQLRRKSVTHDQNEQTLSYTSERGTARQTADASSGNDVSFVSDSQLVNIDEQKKLHTEMSLASESLLMFVGEGAKRFKERFSKKPASAARSEETLKEITNVTEAPKPLSTLIQRPSTTGTVGTGTTAATGTTASTTFGLSTAFSIPPVSVPVQSRESSPARTPRLGGHAGSPNYDGTDSDSDKEDGPCKWCFGDYYPCRCAEKGRNTASMAQKSSPPLRLSSGGVKAHTFNRSRSIQLVRLNAVKVPTDGVPCKWCLGTFVPCFCEEGLPGLEGDNMDQESSEYLEGYNNGRRSSKYIRAGSISEVRRQSINNIEMHSRGASRNGSRKNSHVGHESRWREVYGENSGRIA